MDRYFSEKDAFKLKQYLIKDDFCEAMDKGDFEYCYASMRGVDRHILTEVLGREGVDPTSTLTTIPQGYARWTHSLEEVTTSPNLTAIKSEAFYSSNIRAIEFNKSAPLQKIGSSAFCGTDNLSKVILPDHTQSLDERCFACSSIKRIYLGRELTDINVEAFVDCSKLTEVTLPKTIKFIGAYAFSSTGLTRVMYKGTFVQWGLVQKCKHIFPSGTKVICNDKDFIYLENI